MQSSHRIVTLHFEIAPLLMLGLIIMVVSTSTNAQQPASSPSEERDRGIQLCKEGDASGAIELLRKAVKRRKDDISAWHCLGISLARIGKKDAARKAYERAAKIADALLSSSLDRLVTLPKAQLIEAADSADQYLVLSDKPSKKRIQEWRDRAEFLRVFATDVSSNVEVYSGKDVTTKARVLSKPEPQYTEEARKHQVTGTVVLKVVFAADGHVRAIRVVAGLPDGLTRRAIVASQQIKFIPATKNGHPVSMFMQLEYNFNLY